MPDGDGLPPGEGRDDTPLEVAASRSTRSRRGFIAGIGAGLTALAGGAVLVLRESDHGEHTPTAAGGPRFTQAPPVDTGARPMSVTPERFGAVGDGIADDTDSINRAIAVLQHTTRPRGNFPGCGTVELSPAKIYAFSGPLSVRGTMGLRFVGPGGLAAPGYVTPGSLVWHGHGADPAIDARSSQGFSMDGVTLFNASATPDYRGTLIDFQHDASGTDASGMRLDHCCLGGNAKNKGATIVSLRAAILGSFTANTFSFSAFGVRGSEYAGSSVAYSNAFTFTGNTFVGTTTALANAGQGWNVEANSFEGTGGLLRAYDEDIPAAAFKGGGAASLSWIANWHGDRSAPLEWLHFVNPPTCFAMQRNYIAGGAGGAKFDRGPQVANFATNNFIVTDYGVDLSDGSLGAASAVTFESNDFSSCRVPVRGLKSPKHRGIMTVNNRGPNYVIF